MPPKDLKYTRTHEWIRLETDVAGRKIAVVGITDFAIQVLTDLVFLGLPEVGREVIAGRSFGEIESVKAVSDLNSPIDGEVIEVNSSVAEKLEQLTADPYGEGWLVKVAVRGEVPAELMNADAYQRQCETETHDH